MGHINNNENRSESKSLNFLMGSGAKISSMGSSIHQGAQIFRPMRFGLLTSGNKGSVKNFSLVIFGLLAIVVGGLFVSHSAYAASYVNVSSGGSGGTEGVISLGKIRPSSTGSLATGNDTLTVHTDCSAGYKVYVSGQNGKTTNLINQYASDLSNPSASDIISASSGTIASPAVLSANTWGISGSSTDIENHLYAGLPAYADATSTALVTKTNVEEESTVPIYYGVKANTAINPGTYKGDILYTVLMDSSCIPYTVEFSPNVEDESTITGEMSAQSILPNSATALTANTYKRSGYAFLGWSTAPEGKTGDAVDGIGTEADVDYEDKEEVENLTTGGSSITLYAIWGDLGGDMQGWTGCSKMSDGDTTELTDLRDGTVYEVKKFGDECWMTENLVLGHDKGYALTSELTNIPSNDDGTLSNNGTYYLPQAGYRGALNSSSTSGAPTFNGSNDSQAQVQYRAAGSTGDQSSSGTLGQSTGYYNFYAATLGCSYYQDGNSSCRSGYVAKDICPKGWQLPAGGSNTTKSWVSLDKALNGYSAGSNRTDTTARDRFLNDAGFLYSGYYGSSQLYGVGSNGYWWSSTVFNTNNSYYLYLYSSGYVYPQTYYNKYYGFAVRCVAQDVATITFNANGGTGEMSPQRIYENDDATLKSNTFTRDGYIFLGWSEDANATTATYTNGASASDLVSRGGNITLYAIWEEVQDMQGWSGCSGLSTGGIARLKDTRDNKVYTIKKLPDGKCWMIDNLTISATGMVVDSLDNTNTNIPSSDTNKYYLPPQNARYTSGNSITNSAVKTASTAVNFGSSYSNQPQVGYRAKNTTDNNTGNPVPENTAYYNFYTASLGFSYYNDGKTSGSTPRDICPKGWRLPWVSDSGSTSTGTGDMYTLALSYNNNSNVWSNYITPGSSSSNFPSTSNATVRQNMVAGDSGSLDRFASNGAAGFTYAGYYDGTTLYLVGARGLYWSSSVYDTGNSYYLNFVTADVSLQNGYGKYYGFAVRCVAIENVTVNYDANGGTGTVISTTSTDNKPSTQITLPNNTYTKTDYIFAGWSQDQNATDATFTDGQTVPVTSLTISNGAVTLYAVWKEPCYISDAQGCKLVDGRTWIYGNSGSSSKYFDSLLSTCPSGYSFPTIAVFDDLVQAYGGTQYSGGGRSGFRETTGALYSALGLSSGDRMFWAKGGDYFLYVDSVSSDSSNVRNSYGMIYFNYVLCYK